MRIVVPYAVGEPKTRLAPVFDADERAAFARAMLADVLAAIEAAGREPTVLATDEVDVDAPVIVDERPLTPAVNDVLADGTPTAIVMADLALATADALERLFSSTGDVAIVPGRGGGTNALVVRHPEFRVDYHGASFRDHRRIAERIGADVTVVDSFRLATDVDEPDDLTEVLLHGDGAASAWLRDAGFALAVDGGRVGVGRR